MVEEIAWVEIPWGPVRHGWYDAAGAFHEEPPRVPLVATGFSDDNRPIVGELLAMILGVGENIARCL